MKKNWQILQPDISITEKIQTNLKCSPVIAAILANRNITSEKNARWFLKPSFSGIKPPGSIKDMDTAVNRIYSAIINHEKILIFGDYDVDGITATTIVLKFLRSVNADVSYYIPHRIKEGYSLQSSHIKNYAIPGKTDLIITVDCGSSSNDAIKTAQHAGIDVIITDHHEISDNLPDAVTVLNPKRNGILFVRTCSTPM